MVPFKPCGSCEWISGNAALTPLMTVSRFAFGAIWMPMNTPLRPSKATRAS